MKKIQSSKLKIKSLIKHNYTLYAMRYTLSRGYTLIELALVMSISAVLIGLITLNLVNVSRNTSINTTISTFIADMKAQQTKAMIGDSEGRSTPDNYGVYMGASSYTLFHGTTYSASGSANAVVNIESTLQFATPGASLIFSRLSGNVMNYASSIHSIVIKDTTNNTRKTIYFNKYGVITNVN